ncbi:MAG TPA: universal stress protein [Actinotalea sp.]|nr:universal stress protein [Actinotalea sp.]
MSRGRGGEVLVGADGSDAGTVAVRWAAAEARQLGWRLRVVVPATSAARGDARAVLDATVRQLGDDDLDLVATVEHGDPGEILVEAARDAGLAVIGTNRQGGLLEQQLGVLAPWLPQHAGCPTVVVPVREGRDVAGPVRRIVVGVDGSDAARTALARAVVEAQAWGARLTAVCGVPMSTPTGVPGWQPASVDREALLAEVEAGLDRAVKDATAGRAVDVRRHALDGSGAALLVEFSTAVDLVVVGARGRGGFTGLRLGSTSRTLLHHAACPVMLVPARWQ